MGGWQPGAPGSAPAPPGTVGMERTSPWAENSHGPDQGCLKPQPQWGADTRDPALGRGHILHGSACAAGSVLGAARGQSAALDAHGSVVAAAGGAGPAPISPHWQKGGRPSIGVPGHSPLPSPPLVSRPPLKAQRRPPDPAAQDARMRPPAQSPRAGWQRRQLSNPSASFSPSQPVSPQLCPAPSVRPPARPPVRLSVSLRRARPQRLAGGRGDRAPPGRNSAFSLSLVFPSSFSPGVRPL